MTVGWTVCVLHNKTMNWQQMEKQTEHTEPNQTE